jgi:peptidoglycan/LPS O-acetylase OafA/YrhL
MKSAGRYLELDALRGLAALAVVLFHYSRYFTDIGTYGQYTFLSWFQHGDLGVHLFFIISGFVIFMSLEKSARPKDFLIARFSRLYPTYWTCVILTYIVITTTPFFTEKISFPDMLINLTMLQHWLMVKDVDGVYWTLAIELCFYSLILIIFLFKKLNEIESFGILWLAIMLIVYYVMINNLAPEIRFYYWMPLLKNGTLFFAGIVFYLMKTQGQTIKRSAYILLCIAVHLLINPFFESIVVLLFFLIFYLFVFNKLNFLAKKPLLFLGSISYALYLINQNVGYQLLNFLETSGLRSIYIKLPLALLLIIILATAITYTVEKPAMKFIRGKVQK